MRAFAVANALLLFYFLFRGIIKYSIVFGLPRIFMRGGLTSVMSEQCTCRGFNTRVEAMQRNDGVNKKVIVCSKCKKEARDTGPSTASSRNGRGSPPPPPVSYRGEYRPLPKLTSV